MVKFVGFSNDAGEENEDGQEGEGETLELQEARVTATYQQGLRMMKERRLADATKVLLDTINDKAFERDVTGNQRFIALRNVQYLCVKNLASIAEELGDKAAALEWLGQAVALDDRDVVMWHKLGCIAQDLDRLNVARCSFERGLCLRPQHQLCMEKLCEVTYGIGDFEACESAADQLLRVYPSHPRAMLFKSMAMRHRRGTEMQCEDLIADAREMDPIAVGQLEKKLESSRAKRCRIERPPEETTGMELKAISWRCLTHQTLELFKKTMTNTVEEDVPFNIMVTVSIESASTDAEEDGLARITIREVEQGAKEEEKKEGENAQNGEEDASEKPEDTEFDDRDALCSKCGGDNEIDDDLLLCENFEICGRSFHLTCLNPPLTKTPKGKWFCDKCDQKSEQKKSKSAVTPAPSTPANGSRNSARRGREGTTETPDTGAEGEGSFTTPARGESPNPTPTKKRKSDRFSQPAKDSSRKSLRQSTAELQKPVGAEQLSKIVSLLIASETSDKKAEDAEAEAEAEPSTADAVVAPDTAGEKEEGSDQVKGMTRLQMLQHMSDITVTEVADVETFVEELPQPCCLLELVHRLLHQLAQLSKQHRARGKLLYFLLELDNLAFSRLTYAPEASLTLAELHFDSHLRKIEERRRKKEEEEEERMEMEMEREKEREKEKKKEEKKEGDKAQEQANPTKPKEGEQQDGVVPPRQQVAAPEPEDLSKSGCSIHLVGLWNDRLQTSEDRARHFWLIARVATFKKELGTAVESFKRCRDFLANVGLVLLPSCQYGNSLSVAVVDKTSREPNAELESQTLDQMLKELMSRFSENADKNTNEEIAKQVVEVLAPVVMPEILEPQGCWLVSRPHGQWVCDTDTLKKARAKREDNLCIMLDAFRRQTDHWKQELYTMNALLAEHIGVERVLVEKEDPVLYQPLEEGRLQGIRIVLDCIESWTSHYGPKFAEADEKGAKMLRQLELQMARLFCRLVSSKPAILHVLPQPVPGVPGPGKPRNLLFTAGMALYKIVTFLRLEMPPPKERELLSSLLEEFAKRNLHALNDNEFFRCYLSFLHKQRKALEEAEDLEAAENENEDGPENDDEAQDAEEGSDEDEDEDKDDELDLVMQELAKCYYLMFGAKVRCYKSSCDLVETLLPKEEETSTPSRGKSAARLKTRPPSEFCMGLWEFVHSLCDKASGGREKHLVINNVKDVLETLRLTFPEPPPQVATARKFITDYLRVTHTRTLPVFSPRFSFMLQDWRAVNKPAEVVKPPTEVAQVPADPMNDTLNDSRVNDTLNDSMLVDNPETEAPQSVNIPEIEPPQSTVPPAPSAAPSAVAVPPAAPQSAADALAAHAPIPEGPQAQPCAVALDPQKQTAAEALMASQPQSGAESAGPPNRSAADVLLSATQESAGALVPAAPTAASVLAFVPEPQNKFLVIYRSLYAMLARCYQQSDDKEAIDLFIHDLSINPEHQKSWVGLAKALNNSLHADKDRRIGLRDCSTLDHSPEAEQVLLKAFRAYSAVVVLDSTHLDARMGVGLMLFLRAQGSQDSGVLAPEDRAEFRKLAYEEFEELVRVGQDKADWRAHYFLGNLARKLQKPGEVCLEHLFNAALANDEGDTLGLDPLYKLHATRAKLLLRGIDDVEVLHRYSIDNCLKRARERKTKEVSDGGQASDNSFGGSLAISSSHMQQAQEEQRVYEVAAGNLFEADESGGTNKTEVLRDAMIGIRACILEAKTKRWSFAKGRYRIAKIVSERSSQPLEARCDHVIKMLLRLFFNEKEQLRPQVWFEFLQYQDSQAKLATYSNLGSLMQLKLKILPLLTRHVRDKPPREIAADRLDKLVESLVKDERARIKSNDPSLEPGSVKKSIYAAVHDYLNVLQDILVSTQSADLNSAELVFLKLGKLRCDLQPDMTPRGLNFEVDEALDWTKEAGNTTTSSNEVTLFDKFCPFIRLFVASCTTFCKLKSPPIPYNETSQHATAQKCMGTAMGIWQSNSKKRAALGPSRSSVLSTRVPQVQPRDGNDGKDVEMADENQEDTVAKDGSSKDDSSKEKEKGQNEPDEKGASTEGAPEKQGDEAAKGVEESDRDVSTKESGTKKDATENEEPAANISEPIPEKKKGDSEENKEEKDAGGEEKLSKPEGKDGDKQAQQKDEKQPPKSAEAKRFFIVVPPGIHSGTTILVQLPESAEQIPVVVPADKGPGDRFIYTHDPSAK